MKFWRFAAVVLLLTGCSQQVAYQQLWSAIEHEQHRREDEALGAFRDAVECVPYDPYVRRQLGLAYLRRGMFDEAQAEFEQVMVQEPDYVDTFRDMADLFRARNMPEAALAWLEKAASSVPDYRPLYEDQADLLLLSDRPDEAMRLLWTVVERWPETSWAHYRLGRLHHQLKDFAQAEIAFRMALALQPDVPHAHAFLGNVLFEQGKYLEAIEAYRDAVALDPGDHRSINNLAWVYAVLGERLDEGIRLSRRSLRMDPESPTYLDTLAELYFKNSQFTKAVDIIRYAISLGSEDPNLREHLANQLKRFMAAERGKV